MTHEDLLEGVRSLISDIPADYGQYELLNALEAVINLHKPYGEFVDGKPSFRCQANHEKYPCPTIQAIVKELE